MLAFVETVLAGHVVYGLGVAATTAALSIDWGLRL